MHSFYLAAAHKSSGKTTVSIGLANIFSQDFHTQTFKKGPDYIDPIWLSLASNNPCYNLDFWNMNNEQIKLLYQNQQKQLNIIEGNKGLFDGLSTKGGDSNADIAKLIDIPVILIIDSTGITRGIAPLLQGYINFDKEINIAGVILNKVAGARHQTKLVNAIEEYTDLPVLGSVGNSNDLIINQRHLGLKPANEESMAIDRIKTIGKIIKDSVDVKQILTLTKAKVNNNQKQIIETNNKNKPTKNKPTIAVAKDKAFGFYYNDDLDKLATQANIIFFDTFNASKLPKCDGLFIGGGFPETNLIELGQNLALMQDIKNKIQSGLPTYAECGGMMYLSNSIDGVKMTGVIDADVITTKKPMGRGYMQVKAFNHPWGISGIFNTHEFHYSKLINLKEKKFAFKIERGYGINGEFDGIVKHNLLATYTHQRTVGNNLWVYDFINFINSKISGTKI